MPRYILTHSNLGSFQYALGQITPIPDNLKTTVTVYYLLQIQGQGTFTLSCKNDSTTVYTNGSSDFQVIPPSGSIQSAYSSDFHSFSVDLSNTTALKFRLQASSASGKNARACFLILSQNDAAPYDETYITAATINNMLNAMSLQSEQITANSNIIVDPYAAIGNYTIIDSSNYVRANFDYTMSTPIILKQDLRELAIRVELYTGSQNNDEELQTLNSF